MQALLLVVALAAYASAVTPVSSLNAGNYIGRWYQSKQAIAVIARLLTRHNSVL